MFYYASKNSPNMARTPEGFLLCQNVPIARTGEQVYLASELPLNLKNPEKRVSVYRDEEDVFTDASMASFEGKPVVDEHPDEHLTPDNVREHIKGVSTNIRRGKGEDADKLLADLIIYDAVLITEIENGKREVSCGYDCEFACPDDGRILQKNIVGNHIAVVTAGRAGSRVAIQDAWASSSRRERPAKDKSPEIDNYRVSFRTNAVSSQKHGGRTKMHNKKKKPSERGIIPVLANLWPFFTKDAAPEDLTEVVEDLVEAIEGEVSAKDEEAADKTNAASAPAVQPPQQEQQAGNSDNAGVKTKDDETAALLKQVLEQIAALAKDVETLKTTGVKEPESLDALEDELSDAGGEPEEESNLIEPAKNIDEAADDNTTDTADMQDEAGFIMPKEGRPKTILNKDAALKEVRKMKPIIATIKDPAQRKQMSDSLANMIRATYGIPAKSNKGSSTNGYAAIMDSQKRRAETAERRQVADSNGRNEQDVFDLGRKIAESRNPHHMKKINN